MSKRQGGTRCRAHILVVDDDVEYLSFMELLLQGEGYTVDVAARLDEWEAKLRGTRPDILVCDLWLTDEPPFALLDRLAALPDTDGIPVLVCSGAVRDIDEVSPRLTGRPVAVLAKPFDIDDVLACLDRLLG